MTEQNETIPLTCRIYNDKLLKQAYLCTEYGNIFDDNEIFLHKDNISIVYLELYSLNRCVKGNYISIGLLIAHLFYFLSIFILVTFFVLFVPFLQLFIVSYHSVALLYSVSSFIRPIHLPNVLFFLSSFILSLFHSIFSSLSPRTSNVSLFTAR